MKSNKAALVVSSFLLLFFLKFFLLFLSLNFSLFPRSTEQRRSQRETRECTRPLYDSSSLEDANCELGTRMLHLREQRHFISSGRERKKRKALANRDELQTLDDDFATIYS